MPSLLEKAKAHKTKNTNKPPSPEEVELAVAWIIGDISNSQVIAAMGKNGVNVNSSAQWVLQNMVRILRSAASLSKIEVIVK